MEVEKNGVKRCEPCEGLCPKGIPHLITERTKRFILMIVKKEPRGNKAPGYIATTINRKHASAGQSFIGLMSKLMDM